MGHHFLLTIDHPIEIAIAIEIGIGGYRVDHDIDSDLDFEAIVSSGAA